jgi:hypothetical protein
MMRNDRQVIQAGGFKYPNVLPPMSVTRRKGKFNVIILAVIISFCFAGMVVSSICHP